MDYSERAERAKELKLHGGYNCCQAVTAALADLTDLSEEQLEQIAAGFAAGMGNMEGTCGALVGAVIAAGSATKGQRTVRFARQISERFRKLSGSIVCRELKGMTGGPVLCPCEECVKNAVLAYGEILGQD